MKKPSLNYQQPRNKQQAGKFNLLYPWSGHQGRGGCHFGSCTVAWSARGGNCWQTSSWRKTATESSRRRKSSSSSGWQTTRRTIPKPSFLWPQRVGRSCQCCSCSKKHLWAKEKHALLVLLLVLIYICQESNKKEVKTFIEDFRKDVQVTLSR